MAFDLYLGPAHGSKDDHRQQLPSLCVHSGSGIEIAKAKLGQEAGHRLSKLSGQPGVTLFDLRPIDRLLDGQPLLIPLLAGGERPLLGQGKFDSMGPEDLVHC